MLEFNIFMRGFAIFLCSFFVFLKITNLKELKKDKFSIILLSCLLLSFFHHSLMDYIPFFLRASIICFVSSILMAKITKIELNSSFSAMFIAMGISLVVYMLVVVILHHPLRILLRWEYDNPIAIFITLFLTATSIFWFFKIRRFRDGFPFLRDKRASGLGLLFCGFVLAIYTLATNYRGWIFAFYITISALLCAIGVYIWIRKGIWLMYKDNMKDRTIQKLEERIHQLGEENLRLQKEIERRNHNEKVVHNANHDFNERLSAVELISSHATGFPLEYADVNDQVKTLKAQYNQSLSEKLIAKESLPKTSVTGIDYIFNYLAYEAEKNKIEFQLEVKGCVAHMIETIIPQDELETLIGNLVKNARMAINKDEDGKRNIFVELGLLGNCYGFCVHDTGVEFRRESLQSLGVKPTTTRSNTGGSGVGFMTTFETLQKHKASLVIEETKTAPFTKYISIRFDGNSHYIVRTDYRFEELKAALENTKFEVERKALPTAPLLLDHLL